LVGLAADRRHVLGGMASLLLGAACQPLLAAGRANAGLQLKSPMPYGFAALRDRARRLAAAPYDPPPVAHEALLETIDFDAHQTIAFKPDRTLWPGADSVFPVRPFHLGRYFKRPVRLHVVRDGAAREIRYSADVFEYKDAALAARLPDDLGFAGFRLMEPDRDIDWLAFLGASYFRSAGPEQQYGMSARGLAIDTGLATPEEFPRFSEFWLHRSAPGRQTMIIDALLESESCTGAYRFAISRPGDVVMEVTAHLYIRRDITRLGVAPLTSMFWYSESNRYRAADWRPEVHDSDGLALWTGQGERIWRPLNNPHVVRTSAFVDENPKGFGLLQRDRTFDHYEDDGAFYDKRPGIWVEPLNAWGAGEVQLVEIPTDDEIHDNIAVYWQPSRPVRAGQERVFKYRLHWVAKEPFPLMAAGRAVATRIGRGGIPGRSRPAGTKKFVIDFEGGALDELAQRFDIKPVVDVSRGRVDGRYALKVVGTSRWRAFFDLAVEGKAPVDLRCYLKLGDRVLTETWLFQYLPFDFPA
jgi:glucans biosynthesis protein